MNDTPAPPATSAPEPLLAPRDGLPALVDTPEKLADAIDSLAAGRGPLAVDAERASSYRYSARAYLLQFRREQSGTVLIDPIAVGSSLAPLADVINPLEWVLHAADQDLPGLAELGLEPASLFDTELASRLAGFERVGLAAVTEQLLGLSLAKGHGSADWSRRPLPSAWLNYAALDVEVLLDLRDLLADELSTQDKLQWAQEEFEYVRTRTLPPPSPERWRRTTNIHTVSGRRGLAIVRELYATRNHIAESVDLAPKRLLPDTALVAAAEHKPRTVEQLRAIPGFGGGRQRRHSPTWLAAIERAFSINEADLPAKRPPSDNGGRPGVPRPRPGTDAAQRLSDIRAELTVISDELSIPVENLVPADATRRIAHEPPLPVTESTVSEALIASEVRPWQVSLVSKPIEKALLANSGTPDED
ncbi:ribonuclease D [Hoyosella rhizosphaerae]|uniref:Ribonuclease D n=1 Tax=Hoyosella rhizosphaerae TaxID=1755582 RepID=A0A916U548_9ACTN|nr:HRDC domain-containing protein [Hoyosella rhizosphaerae]MBN4926393.1 ribonuclease D [Hoyosella rhizosphaerae]GGC59738.1 ribonuclease D [Hoyosella rhizosphaerae]